MTKIMAVLLPALFMVLFLSPQAEGQDAKSVAIDATEYAAIHKESTPGLQRVREVLNKRALHEQHKRHVAIERRAKAKARAEAKAEAATQAPAPTYTVPSDISTVLACIREHESGGNYQAVNSGGYAGAYQLSPYYKDDWARRYGYGQYANIPVVQWPNSVQDAVATGLFRDTNGGAWFDFAPYSC